MRQPQHEAVQKDSEAVKAWQQSQTVWGPALSGPSLKNHNKRNEREAPVTILCVVNIVNLILDRMTWKTDVLWYKKVRSSKTLWPFTTTHCQDIVLCVLFKYVAASLGTVLHFIDLKYNSGHKSSFTVPVCVSGWAGAAGLLPAIDYWHC